MFGWFFAALMGAAAVRMFWGRRRFAFSPAGGHGGRGARRLMRELNASPSQEAALREAADEVRRAFRDAKPWSRLDPLLAALEADSFDRQRLVADMRESAEMESARNTVANVVERVRGILDIEQRRKLVDIVNRLRSGRMRHGGRC